MADVVQSRQISALSIGRIRLPPLVFQISGVYFDCIPHLYYLGVWLDTTLLWREHIR